MKHITQAHMSGCVPAAFAMVTGDHYYGSLGFFKPRDFDWVGTSALEAMDVLKMLGYKYEYVDQVDLDTLDKDAILIVKSKFSFAGDSCGQHAVAWDSKKKKVRDPSVGILMTKHLTKKEYQANLLCAIIVGQEETMSKFYKTTFTVEVLSEEPIGPDFDLESIAYEITDGDCVGQSKLTKVEELDVDQVKVELAKMGSEPEFFLSLSECLESEDCQGGAS